MFHRDQSIAQRTRGRVASALLCLGGLTIALAVPATVAASDTGTDQVQPASPLATVCTDGHWPASVQGRPRFVAGSRAGDRIWHDANGWHLRVTHPGQRGVVFSGTIQAGTPLTVKGVRLEKQDHFNVSADGLTITYRFVNHGRIDGLDFKTACATQLTFLSKMGGHKLSTARIWLGHHGRHPVENPFVIIRVN